MKGTAWRTALQIYLPLLLFVLVSVLSGLHWLAGADAAVERFVQPLWLPVFAAFWLVIGTLGSAEISALLLLVLLAIVWKRDPRLCVWLAGIFVAGNLIELVFKHSMNHPGPPHLHTLPPIYLPDSYILRRAVPSVVRNSYPSGHMFRSLVVLATLVLAFPRRNVLGAAILAALVVAWILVICRVHWPSDVAGGFLLAWALLSFVTSTARPRGSRRRFCLEPWHRILCRREFHSVVRGVAVTCGTLTDEA
jgi:membrane-associated phospholipid phosphatase